MSHNRNPKGHNQFVDVLKADDPRLIDALTRYHRELITNNAKISELLLADYGIVMSETTVKRRRKNLGLSGSAANMKTLDRTDAEQLVLNQMDSDPTRHQGVRTTRHKISMTTGQHLTRDFVAEVMHTHDPEGFTLRDPSGKKIVRVQKFPIGIHERWSGDGHEKLNEIGFPIWAAVDDATGKWLGVWVLPNNRKGDVIAILFLCLVEKYGGVPLQFTTDCGSETTQAFGLANALRETFHPDYDREILPPHIYVRSIHNISIERSWLRLRLEFGDNAADVFKKGIAEGLYNPHDVKQYELCQWLWPKLLRQLLQEFMESRNAYKMRRINEKPGPSGMSRNEAFSLPQNWGGRNCLLKVDVDFIRALKAELGGEAVLEFVTPAFAQRAEAAYATLGIMKLGIENVWHVFQDLYPLVFT